MAKRGRPILVSDEYIKMSKTIWPELKSRRGLINRYYQLHALKIIRDMTDLENREFLDNQAKEYINWSVLLELGRLRDEENIKTVARIICQRAKTEKYTVKQWELICRNARYLCLCE